MAPAPASATDFTVYARCDSSRPPAYVLDPDSIAVTAGIDRIQFQVIFYDDDDPCYEHWIAIYAFDVWGSPFGQAFATYWEGGRSGFEGPFCEPGRRNYNVYGLSSNGYGAGVIASGVIDVRAAGLDRPAELGDVELGVYADPEATTCVLPDDPGSHVAYVCARIEMPEAASLSGAEFRVRGLPPEWRATARQASAIGDVALGNPLQEGVRARIRGSCPTPSAGVLVLYEITYEVSTPAQDGEVWIESSQPSTTGRPHLLFYDCTESVREVCAVGRRSAIGGSPAPCAVAVEATTWTRVKRIFASP